MVPLDEDAPPASPAESLRVIAEQQEAAHRKLQADPLVFFAPWGVAWLVGFGAHFLRFGPDGRVFVPMPAWLPLAVLYASLAGAGAVSGILASRSYRHVHGRSATQGTMYGFTWLVAFAGVGLTLPVLSNHMPADMAGLMWSSVCVGLTGALHTAGGAVFQDKLLFGLGVWITTINVVGTLLGPGWHALVIALAGGAAMLAFGFLIRPRWTGTAT
jgi:hypothetical protein